MKDVSRRLSLWSFVLLEDRSARKSDVVGILEMLTNLCMHLSKLGAMTLVNYEHTLLLFESIHNGTIFFGTECCRHLLNGRNNQCL